MAYYEHVFIARPDLSVAQIDALTEEFKSVAESGGAKVPKTEYWGLKSLAYKIKKNRKAHYVLMNIDGPHPAVAEVERQERIHDDIIRCMTIRVDELENGPSIMMRAKSERRGRRDDRGPGGDRRSKRRSGGKEDDNG